MHIGLEIISNKVDSLVFKISILSSGNPATYASTYRLATDSNHSAKVLIFRYYQLPLKSWIYTFAMLRYLILTFGDSTRRETIITILNNLSTSTKFLCAGALVHLPPTTLLLLFTVWLVQKQGYPFQGKISTAFLKDAGQYCLAVVVWLDCLQVPGLAASQ